MGLLTRSCVKAFSVEDPSQPWLPGSALFESLGLGRSDAGVLVNEKQALRLTTALACIKIISEDLGTTSHEILQQMPDGSMRVANDHMLWGLIHDRPNPYMSASLFWGAFVACVLAWGNGYAWIKKDVRGRPMSLHVLDPARTSPKKGDDGSLIYVTTQTQHGKPEPLDPSEVLHVTYLSLDGINGLSPIATCKNAFGLALAAEKFGALFFGQGARASGVFTHPETLEGEAYENLKKSLHERISGENQLQPLILEEGMDWKQLTIPPNDAQFLQTRQFQDVSIARLYRMPMHMLQDLTRATNNNIEHQGLEYVRFCIRPNAVKIEQEVNFKLLGGGPFTMEHNLKDMQRGDFASQAAGIQILRNIGFYHDNDIARDLRLKPIPEEEGGNIRVIQGAFINLTALLASGDEAPAPAVTGAPDDTEPYDHIVPVFRNMVIEAVGRVCRAGNKPEFAKKLLSPIARSITQVLLVRRFGNCDLTQKEEVAIAAGAARAVADCADWEAAAARGIGERVVREMYDALRKEILA